MGRRIRKELQKRDGERFRCRATVGRWGSKPSFRGPPTRTILLLKVTDVATGKILTDHLWFTAGQWSYKLAIGDIFEFDARVAPYVKEYGNKGKRDWKMQRPTKVAKVPRNPPPNKA